MQGILQQQSIEVEDALVVQELFYQNEWTDGLPVVPPTQDKIEAMQSAGIIVAESPGSLGEAVLKAIG